MSQTPSIDAPAERSYDDVLADAVRVLAEAARLTRPVLVPASPGQAPAFVLEALAFTVGEESSATPQEVRAFVESGRREPADFAEFAALALVAAAANVGGVEAVLAGRPGSWEADALRGLLLGTVGHDEEYLLEHRTEPVVVEVFVEEILTDQGVWDRYDAALTALDNRAEAAGLDAPEQDEIGEQLVELERQREQTWAAYGDALTAHIKAAAEALPGLKVPVHVVVDLDTVRDPEELHERWGVAERLLQEAIEAVPVPSGPATA